MKTILIQALALSCSMILYGPVRAQCTTSGYNGGASFTTTGAGLVWSNPSNAQAADGSVSTTSVALGIFSSATTNYLVATNFGFAVPAGSTICGITVQIKRYGTGLSLGVVKDNSVMIVQGGAIGGTEMASGANWPGGNSFATYGGIANTWGLAWLPSDVNSAGFGVAISARMSTIVGIAMTTDIDYVQIAVTYNTTVLAITQQDFTLKRTDQGNLLSWVTIPDQNPARFTVQRSAGSRPWEDLSILTATANQQQYSYLDPNPPGGSNAYRLLVQTPNGQDFYSPVHVIDQYSPAAIGFYPNPATTSLHITSPGAMHSVQIRDIEGRLLSSMQPDGSSRDLQVPIAALPPGLYLLQVDKAVFKWVKN